MLGAPVKKAPAIRGLHCRVARCCAMLPIRQSFPLHYQQHYQAFVLNRLLKNPAALSTGRRGYTLCNENNFPLRNYAQDRRHPAR
ncbi:hypothetical protein, partial [Massilia sp. TWR1-2-2]|uniref:hypothetical protein n=1 Tax=Massilia sp. TWR1-2-2 TaxID=2804584 RepID=UPI003CF21F7A